MRFNMHGYEYLLAHQAASWRWATMINQYMAGVAPESKIFINFRKILAPWMSYVWNKIIGRRARYSRLLMR